MPKRTRLSAKTSVVTRCRIGPATRRNGWRRSRRRWRRWRPTPSWPRRKKRLVELMADLLGVTLAAATIARISRDFARRFQGFANVVRDHIAAAPVKHMDETGFRIGGKTRWLHVACTALLTFYHVCTKRGSLLANVAGIVVHDHWKPYYTMPGVLHALCNVETHQARFSRMPYLVAADAAFYSGKNEAAAKAKGVKRVCIPNRSTKSPERKREQKKRWFRNGQKWRTGCEGRIS